MYLFKCKLISLPRPTITTHNNWHQHQHSSYICLDIRSHGVGMPRISILHKSHYPPRFGLHIVFSCTWDATTILFTNLQIVKLWAPMSIEVCKCRCHFQTEIQPWPFDYRSKMLKFKYVHNGKLIESVMKMSSVIEGLSENELNRPWSTAMFVLTGSSSELFITRLLSIRLLTSRMGSRRDSVVGGKFGEASGIQ